MPNRFALAERSEPRATYYYPEPPPARGLAALGVWLAVAVSTLAIVGALVGLGAAQGAFQTTQASQGVAIKEIAADVKETKGVVAKLVSDQLVIDALADRTAQVEALTKKNLAAIRASKTQAEKDHSALSRVDTRQSEQATQQTMDRVTAEAANHRQDQRATQVETRQAATASALSAAEQVILDRQDRDRKIAAETARALAERQAAVEVQQNVDRAATQNLKPAKKR